MLMFMIVALIALLLLRVPLPFALLIPSLVYFLFEGATSGSVFAQQAISGVDNFVLIAVPLFILMGNIVANTRISDRMFDGVTAAVGRVPGSLGYVNILASFGFSWMSGAALGDVAANGRVQYQAMIKRGYDQKFTLGLTGASALVSPVLPPSIPAIVLAVTASLPVSGLFAAGVVPGLLIVIVLAISVWLYARRHPNLGDETMSIRDRMRRILTGLPALGAGVVVVGGIFSGFMTPTEAAAAGVFYMCSLGLVFRDLTWSNLKSILGSTVESIGSVIFLMGPSALFAWVLAREQAAMYVSEVVTTITQNPVIFLLLVSVVLLIVGAIIDPTAGIIIMAPVFFPVAMQLGVDPFQLGTVMILNLMIGLLTPPVGLVLFVLSNVTGTSIGTNYRAVVPFYIPLLLVLLLLILFPPLTTWLPSLT